MKKCIMKNMGMKIKQNRFLNPLILYFFFIFLPHLSFSQQKPKSIPMTPRYTIEEINNMKNSIKDGDTVAFMKYCCFIDYSPEKLIYALYMANKYNYSVSYYEVYELSLKSFQECGLMIDSISYLYAFSYLLKGSELGCYDCNLNLARIYYVGNRYIERDTTQAKTYFMRGYYYGIFDETDWDTFKKRHQKEIIKKDEQF